VFLLILCSRNREQLEVEGSIFLPPLSGEYWSPTSEKASSCVHRDTRSVCHLFIRKECHFKTTLQSSMLATTSVTDVLSSKTETPFGFRSGSIVWKICSRRTVAYDASNRANSSANAG
jgi:hypothetical protein